MDMTHDLDLTNMDLLLVPAVFLVRQEEEYIHQHHLVCSPLDIVLVLLVDALAPVLLLVMVLLLVPG
jgi:hypothetical protein